MNVSHNDQQFNYNNTLQEIRTIINANIPDPLFLLTDNVLNSVTLEQGISLATDLQDYTERLSTKAMKINTFVAKIREDAKQKTSKRKADKLRTSKASNKKTKKSNPENYNNSNINHSNNSNHHNNNSNHHPEGHSDSDSGDVEMKITYHRINSNSKSNNNSSPSNYHVSPSFPGSNTQAKNKRKETSLNNSTVNQTLNLNSASDPDKRITPQPIENADAQLERKGMYECKRKFV